ncbi:MAG: ABC transporter permease [Succinivibrionaceae bacterium]
MEIINDIKAIFPYRDMIASLVRRELRGRYKGTILGFLWTFINPLLQLCVYTFVFSHIMKMGIEKYYLFLFVALIPWLFLANSIGNGCSCILSNKNLVTKIYFPREVLPIATVTANFVNMCYCFIVVFAVVLLFSDNVNFIAWLYLPIIAAVEYILVLGLVFIFSALTVFFRDLEHILSVIIMAWHFLVPIIYPLSMVPEEYLFILNMNPMTPVIVAFRDILYYGQIPNIETLLSSVIFGVVSLVIGLIVFNKLKKKFAEEL